MEFKLPLASNGKEDPEIDAWRRHYSSKFAPQKLADGTLTPINANNIQIDPSVTAPDQPQIDQALQNQQNASIFSHPIEALTTPISAPGDDSVTYFPTAANVSHMAGVDNNVAAKFAKPQAQTEAPPAVQAPETSPTPAPKDADKKSTDKTSDKAPDKAQGDIPTDFGAGMYGAGMEELKSAANTVAGAAQAQAKRDEAIHDSNITSTQRIQQDFQRHMLALDDEYKQHQQEVMSGMIDPEKFWDNHSKIASGIGMILAGFNPTTAPNAAVNFLKFQMEQDLKAQQENLGAKNNLLKATITQYGNVRDGVQAYRAMQAATLGAQLAKSAATAASPMAKAAALQAKGQIDQAGAQFLGPLSIRQAVMNTKRSILGQDGGAYDEAKVRGQLNALRMYDPEGAKQLEQLHVPGVGVAENPVPENVRQNIVNTKALNDLFNKSLEFSAQHGGINAAKEMLNPIERQKVLNQARTIQSQLIGQIKQAQHDGVYKTSEAEYLLGQVGGDSSSFLANMNSTPQIKQLMAIKQGEYNQLLSTYGLKPQQLPQSNNQQSPAPEIRNYGGEKYQRVQGGWKKVQ